MVLSRLRSICWVGFDNPIGQVVHQQQGLWQLSGLPG